MYNTKYRAKNKQHPRGGPQPEEIPAVQSLQPQIHNLRSNIGLLGKAFNVRTQTGFRFAHIVLSLRQHLDRLRNDDDGTGAVDRAPGGKYRLPACLLRKFRSDQPSLTCRKKAMPKILVVDDNRIHLACAVYSLRKHFLPENVLVATNGREALEIMEHVVIDCICLDTEMPTMNGLEMADVVRHVENNMGQREFRTLIVGMLTPPQAANEDLLTECLVAGMDRFCVKPLSVHMHAILDAVTVSGNAVEGFRRKALELQWVSRHPQLQSALFGKELKNAASASPAAITASADDDNGNNGSDQDSPPTAGTAVVGAGVASLEERRRAQEAVLTLAPDLHDERQMLQLVERDQRPTLEDIFARERRDDTERMQHATALLRDRIEDLERKLALATGESRKTMESLHVQTIAKLEKQAEEQRLQIMKLSVRNRELTQRNDKLEEDMRQIIRHGANNARTVRAAFRFIGQVQRKMERYESQIMGLEDRSANLGWQNYFGTHFQGTSGRKQFEMPEAAEDFSSSWYHEQMTEAHRITARSNESCAQAVLMLGELLEHINVVRPESFGGGTAASSAANSRLGTPAATPAASPLTPPPPLGDTTTTTTTTSTAAKESSDFVAFQESSPQRQQQQQPPSPQTQSPTASNSNFVGSASHQQASAWRVLHRDIETVVHTLTSLLMQNVKDLTEGTKRNISNMCIRELQLWKKFALFDKEGEDSTFMDVPPKDQDEIRAIVERMQAQQYAKQMRSAACQTEGFEVPPWVTDGGVFGGDMTAVPTALRGRRKSLAGGSLAGDSDTTGGGGMSSPFMTEVDNESTVGVGRSGSNKRRSSVAPAGALAATGAKDWTFTGLINKLRPIITFEGYVPLDVRQMAFEKICESVLRLERRQLGELGESTKKLIREARHTYTNVEVADEKHKVLLLGDVSGRTTLHFREILRILNNVTDNLPGIVDAVIVHTLKSIEPSSGNARATKERMLAVALLESLESSDSNPPLTCPWGEAALHHKVRAGETWEALEKGFGVSMIEMRRLNDDVVAEGGGSFDEPPAAGTLLKLPSRPEYIRSKFATLYHPKTTFSKSGTGARSSKVTPSQHQQSPTYGGHRSTRGSESHLSASGMMSMRSGSRLMVPGMMSRTASNRTRSGSSMGRTPDPFMMTRASTRVGMPSQNPTRGPSRMMRGAGAPSFINRRRESVADHTLLHLNDQVNSVGTSQNRRTNARVAAAALQQSKARRGGGKSSASPTSDSGGELTLAIPGDAASSPSPTDNNKNNNKKSPPNKKPGEFHIPVTVLATEAPKTLRELADEFGVDEKAIREANPHLSPNKTTPSGNFNPEEEQGLDAGAELHVPVDGKFVAKSLTEARNDQLLTAMEKYHAAFAAAAAAAEAEKSMMSDSKRKTTDGEEEEEEDQEAKLAATEKTKSTAAAAAAAARESALAADHAAALHRALLEHLAELGQDSADAAHRSSSSPSGGGDAAAAAANRSSSPGAQSESMDSRSMSLSLNQIGTDRVREDSLRRTTLQKVVLDMPVKEATSFERMAQLYGIKNEDLVEANPTLQNPIAAGEVLKVPVNIEEWRERVAQTATDQYNKHGDDKSGAHVEGVQKVDSMIVIDDGEDGSRPGSLSGALRNEDSIFGMKSSGSGGDHDNEDEDDPENSLIWSREERALFASVKASLRQRELVVNVKHRESEYGVTLETIIGEYNCAGGVGRSFFMFPDIKPAPATATATTGTATTAPNSKPTSRRHSVAESLGHATSNSSKHSGTDHDDSRSTAAMGTAHAAAVAAAVVEIEKLNKDTGAIIRDDDDDNSVNPNVPLLVPVPLASVLSRLVDYILDLQKRCIDLSHAIMHETNKEADMDNNDFGVFDSLRQIKSRSNSMVSESAAAAMAAAAAATSSASPISNIPMVTADNETVASSQHQQQQQHQKRGQLIVELTQLEEYVQNHMECAAELLEVYLLKVSEKLSPDRAAASTMTDNVSNILLAAAGGHHHHHFGGGSRRGSKVSIGGETQSSSTAAAGDAERDKQLAAAAVLLGVDDIDDVPAALRNQKMSQVATSFLERMKDTYAAPGVRHGARRAPHRTQQQHGLLDAATAAAMAAGSAHQPYSGTSPQQSMFGGGVLIDGLRVVGNKAGASSSSSPPQNNAARNLRAGGGAGHVYRGSVATNMLLKQNAQSIRVSARDYEHDRLRQRMARLGFQTSAEALYGDADALARLHEKAPLVESMLRVHRDDGNIVASPTTGAATSSPSLQHSARQQQQHAPRQQQQQQQQHLQQYFDDLPDDFGEDPGADEQLPLPPSTILFGDVDVSNLSVRTTMRTSPARAALQKRQQQQQQQQARYNHQSRSVRHSSPQVGAQRWGGLVDHHGQSAACW